MRFGEVELLGNIISADGAAAGDPGDNITITAGSGNATSGDGGSVNISAGVGVDAGDGGNINLTPGAGAGAGSAGAIIIAQTAAPTVTTDKLYNDGGALTWNGIDISAAAGDVTKVGTPVDNQVGVWTGDGTIEGDANFVWTGTTLDVNATITLGTQNWIIGGNGTSRLTINSNDVVSSGITFNDSAGGTVGHVYGDDDIYLAAANNDITFRGRQNGAAIMYHDDVEKWHTTNNGAALDSGQRINFDGSVGTGDTYIISDATDVLNLYAGGSALDWDGTTVGGTLGELRFTERADHASIVTAGEGYLWVRNDTPSSLIFTDDAGTDVDLTAINAAGISGTPVNNQVAVWVNDSDIEGASGLTYDGNELFISSSSAEVLAINDTGGATAAATDTRMTFQGNGAVRARLRYSGGDFRMENLEGPIDLSPALSSGDEIIDILRGGLQFLERADHPVTAIPARGQLWLRNDTPNVLVFTDDAGTDHDLTGGGTPISISDADGDTQIQVEEAADEDTIRFDTGDNVTGFPAQANALIVSSGQFTLALPAANVAATAGGDVSLTAGVGNTTGTGGDVSLTAGAGGATAAGGAVSVTAGDAGATSGDGGSITITGGDASGSGDGGSINLVPGTGAGTIGIDGKTNVTNLEAPMPLNNQTGTTYGPVLDDADKMITLNNASAVTVTIPANSSVAFPIGTKLNFMQLGAGQVTIAITTDTLNIPSALTANLTEQYATATALKVTSTSWVLFGNLEAA